MKRLAITLLTLSVVLIGCGPKSNYVRVDGQTVSIQQQINGASPDEYAYEFWTVGDSKFVKIGKNLWCHEKYGNQYAGFENYGPTSNAYNFTMFPIFDAEGKPVKCEVKK